MTKEKAYTTMIKLCMYDLRKRAREKKRKDAGRQKKKKRKFKKTKHYTHRNEK